METGLITSNTFLEHLTGLNHVEAPERVTSILEHLKLTNLLDSLTEIQPGTPSRLIPQLVHSPEYVYRVDQNCIKTIGMIGPRLLGVQSNIGGIS